MTRLSSATVLAHGIETRYLRIGTGPTVVVIRPLPPHADPGLEPLISSLAGQFRVLVPELPASVVGKTPEEDMTCEWIQGVLDGLGVSGVLLLLPSQLTGLGACLQLEDGDRIKGVAVLPEGAEIESTRRTIAGFFGMPRTA